MIKYICIEIATSITSYIIYLFVKKNKEELRSYFLKDILLLIILKDKQREKALTEIIQENL